MPVPNRRPRLQGIKNNPPKRQRAPAQTAAPAESEKKKCPNCKSEKLEAIDDLLVCQECFAEVANTNIVADVVFEESAGGRATVQGGTVGDNARHAKTMGAPALRKIGGGERNTAQDIQNQGRRILSGLCPKLGIEEYVQIQAEQIWSLAAGINFSAGRKTDEVAAACLYAACRRQKDNRILLMDIAELVKIGVYRIAEVYRDLCKDLYMNNESVGQQHLQELEPLIKKYCDKLQFGDKTKVVAEDALKIIRRMNRDWIVAGRHPAGLCGACIILAARMNNFQRSVREVVYVSKVADATIAKRVEEFRRTKSAGLSVEQFREFANRIKHQHDPPSLLLSEHRQEIMDKRRKKRETHVRTQQELRESQERQSQQPNGVIEISDDATDASSRLSSLDPDGLGDVNNPASEVQTAAAADSIPAPLPTPPTTQVETQPIPVTQPPAPEAVMSQPSRKRKSGADDITPEGAETDGSPAQKRQRTAELESSEETSASEVTEQESPKRKCQDEHESNGDGEDGPAQKRARTTEASPAPSREASQPPPRYDADGFAIPALPAQSELLNDSDFVPPKRRPGRPRKDEPARPKKDEKPPEIDISQEELDHEDYLEKQIEKALEDGEVEEHRGEVEEEKKEAEEQARQEALERAQALSAEQQKLDAIKFKERREAEGFDSWWNTDADDLALEFENDPEIENCILKPHEVAIKEKIWVAHNEDWLRKQAEKEMMAQVAKVTNPSGKGRKSKKGEKGAKRKKRSKMGDGTVLTESSTPIETPEDAARAMLEKRAPQKSAHIDFSVIQRIYGRQTPSRSGSTTPAESGAPTRDGSPAASREPSVASAAAGADEEGSASPSEPPNDGDEDRDEATQRQAKEVGINENPTEDDDNAEEDYRKAIGEAPEEDEFGAVGFGDEYAADEYGDDYGDYGDDY